MPVERSAGIILFRDTPEGWRYLVIRSSRDESTIAKGKTVAEFWDFTKGQLEAGEKGVDAARREAKEEVGIEDFELIDGFKETARYFTRREGKPVPKFVAMFLARAKSAEVTLSWEHDLYEWLPYAEAHERITLVPMKKILESAEEFLSGGLY